MVNACVLIRVAPGRLEAVVEAVSAVTNVRKAFMVFGRYDVVAFVEAPDCETACKTALTINALEGVKSTETAIEL